MSAQPQTDYSHELEIVKRMLQPGSIPMGDSWGWEQPADDEMAYLGEVEVECCMTVRIEEITHWKWLQRYIRNCARQEKIYEKWDDSVDLEAEELTCRVEYPLAKMSAYEQARYRLRVLLINSQFILGGDAHEWALQVSRDQSRMYWEEEEAKREKWESDCELDSVMSLLLATEVDLQPWSYTYEVYGEELPETPPLAWVKASKAVARLFRLAPKDLEYDDELDLALAYAIEALIEHRPAQWHKELYLVDALRLNLETFEACQNRLADCLATIPELADYAEEIRLGTDFASNTAILRRLYEDAPKRGIWLIT